LLRDECAFRITRGAGRIEDRGQIVGPCQPERAGDRERRGGMIAGDHERADAGRDARGHGGPSLVARRVDHADEPGEHELLLDVARDLDGRPARGRCGGVHPPRQAEHPQRPCRQIGVRPENLGSSRLRERHPPASPRLMRATRQDRFRSALRMDDESAVGGPHHHRHCLPLRVERHLGDHGLRRIVQDDARLHGGDEQGALRGIPDHLPPIAAIRVRPEGRVVAAGADHEDLHEVRVVPRITRRGSSLARCARLDRKLAPWHIARA